MYFFRSGASRIAASSVSRYFSGPPFSYPRRQTSSPFGFSTTTVGKPSTLNFFTSFGFSFAAFGERSDFLLGESTIRRTYFSAAALRKTSVSNTSLSRRLHHTHQSLPEKSMTTCLPSAAAFFSAAS